MYDNIEGMNIVMEKIEIFRQLIDTDGHAQKLYADAVSHQERLDEEFVQLKKQLRQKYYDEADKFISLAENQAIKKADNMISDLNLQLEQSLSNVRQLYNQRRDKWSDIIFNAAINMPTGE